MDSKHPKDVNTSISTTFSYSIPGLDIEEGPLMFKYISIFLSLITPYDLPLDLVRDALHSNLSWTDFLIKAMQIESGFIVLMALLVIMSFIPLGATIAWCCSRRSAARGHNPQEPINPLMLLDDTLENSIHCRRRTSIIVLILLFAVLITCDVLIFISNSQLRNTVNQTPDLIRASVHDMNKFLKDTHGQIKYQLDNGFDNAIDNITADLHDIDVLLGEPIKDEVSSSIGIELAFDSLSTISLANAELITRIQLLQDSLGKALKISQEAAARMEELQIQLSVLQRQCTFRDRPLCDTLRIRSFEENGIIDALKSLQEDQNIFRMKYLGELESGTQVKNLSTEVAISKSIFGNFPTQVKSDTVLQKKATLEELEQIKHKTAANAHLLTHTITSLVDDLSGTWESIEPHYKTLQSWQDKFWSLTWGTAMIVVFIVLFMCLTFGCFCCNSNVKAAVIMVIAVCIICVGSFYLMFFGVITLAVGGNAEIFLCQPLFDNNQYEFLGKLFDKPGYVYEHEPENGIIAQLLRPKTQNKTYVEVSLASAIKECEQNKPSFKVFQLDAFVDTEENPTTTKQYEKVNTAISAIRVSEKTLLSLTQTIQTILESMLKTSDLNSTTYRTNIAQPTPEKDLATFIDQMQRVALQIQDVATSARMTTLGSRAKRLQASILQPLELLRNEILYHLTALELQRDPWQRQVNQTLIHLKNIQGYLENTAGEICTNQTRIYIKRLKAYLSLDKGHPSYSSLGEKTAMCRPLYDIFDVNRNFICRNAVDLINGIWFCTFICLLCWSIGTPIGLNIISLHYKLIELNQVKRSNANVNKDRKGNWRSRNEDGSPTTQPRTPKRSHSNRTPNRGSLPRQRTTRQGTVDAISIESLEVEPGDVSGGRQSVNHNNNETRNNNNMRNVKISRDMSSNQRPPPTQPKPKRSLGRQDTVDVISIESLEIEPGNSMGRRITLTDNNNTRNMRPTRDISPEQRYQPKKSLGRRDTVEEISIESFEIEPVGRNDGRMNIKMNRDASADPREQYRNLQKSSDQRNLRDIREVRSNFRDTNREYRVPRPPPAPPAPPPVPPPDYMNTNRFNN